MHEELINWLPILIALVAGFALGLAVSFGLRIIQSRTSKQLAEELFRESEERRNEIMESVMGHIKASFGSLSLEALGRSTDEFLKLAKSRLDSDRAVGVKELEAKKGLIDEQLKRMGSELENVGRLVKELEKDRVEKFGDLTGQLKLAREQTADLASTTNALREALASTKQRGQWGERMAEDVMRAAGFVEGINYQKQKTMAGMGTRPDFTFFLPRDLTVNMDVKFPLDNYLRYLESESGLERASFRGSFLKDVKARIKEVTTREYINPDQNTLDYVLLFIPNEHIYAFIHEQDSSILDESMKSRVILCSPLTLFAVLAVIRQAVDSFALERTSNEILSLLGAFKKQWDLFLGKLEVVGKRINDAQKEYEALTTTRRRQLERPLNRVDELRTQRGLPRGPDRDREPPEEGE